MTVVVFTVLESSKDGHMNRDKERDSFLSLLFLVDF